MSRHGESSWFGGLLSSFTRYPTLPNLTDKSSSLVPKELIGTGCNSAVWSAEVMDPDSNENDLSLDDRKLLISPTLSGFFISYILL